MSENPLPADVLALLDEHVETFDRLETLLLLRDDRTKIWTAPSVGQALNAPAHLAAEALAHLCKQSLLEETTSGSTPAYRYGGLSPELDQSVQRLAQIYAERRSPILRHLSSKAVERLQRSSLRLFADAFLVGPLRRKKDPDG